MKKFKIKKGDRVMITTGKEKGKIGTIERVITEKDRMIVAGLNKVVSFNKGTETGMSTVSMSVHVSNLAHVDPVDGKATRVKTVINGDTKQFISKRSGKVIR